jgi:hypothetical protein
MYILRIIKTKMYIYIRFKKSRDHLKNKVESLPLKPNRTTA